MGRKCGKGGIFVNLGKRKIDAQTAASAIRELETLPFCRETISLRELIEAHFDVLSRTGRSVKDIYEYLKSKGLDVGTYEGFRCVYRRVKIRGEAKTSVSPKPVTVQPEPNPTPVQQKTGTGNAGQSQGKENTAAPERPRGVGLRPLFLPDGTEIEIDPETGARIFKIKSKRRREREANQT
jgi:hypothetical protein